MTNQMVMTIARGIPNLTEIDVGKEGDMQRQT